MKLLRQLTVAAMVCMAVAALAQTEQRESPVDAALRDLTSQDPGTRERALYALLAQSGIKVPVPNTMRVKVNNLLRTHPQQAERIKTTLIAALERQGADQIRQIQESQPPYSEEFAESWTALTSAVAALQDPRAVKGLVLALPAGSIEGLADICPAAVDAIIQRIHEPDLYSGGVVERYRGQAFTALAWCLQRPGMMRANPGVLAKIRRELLADLGEQDCTVRGNAMAALSALRADPEVRARLQIMATSGPTAADYSKASKANKPDLSCILRYGASSILSSDAFSFYVTRTPGTRVCRVQPTAEALVKEQFIGPERKAMLKPLMCSHYDPTGQDPSLCWKVEPANACSW